MKVVLDGIYNFLNFLNENWTLICSIFVVALAIAKKAQAFFAKSKEEREEIAKAELENQIAIAKSQISEIMLRLVTEAEQDYRLWLSAGEIKRSQVINEVFEMYPILSKVTNQEEIIAFLDDAIKEALKTMRKIFEENQQAETTATE